MGHQRYWNTPRDKPIGNLCGFRSPGRRRPTSSFIRIPSSFSVCRLTNNLPYFVGPPKRPHLYHQGGERRCHARKLINICVPPPYPFQLCNSRTNRRQTLTEAVIDTLRGLAGQQMMIGRMNGANPGTREGRVLEIEQHS
jgi:hypothetical protein